MREITRGEDVRNGCTVRAAHFAAFGQMCFDEGAMLARQLTKWVQRFHHTSALRPAAACAGGKRDYRHLAIADGAFPCGLQLFRSRPRSLPIEHILWPNILDCSRGWQAILSEADAMVFQVGADLLMLHAIKAI